MDCPTEGHQWAVRAAYRKGWEVRLAYYERLLGSAMQMLDVAKGMMQVDDLEEALQDVARAIIALENAWATLSLKTSASLVHASEQSPRQPERDDGDDEE